MGFYITRYLICLLNVVNFVLNYSSASHVLPIVGSTNCHCVIEGLLVPPGKAYALLTDHLITGLTTQKVCLSLSRKSGLSQTIHT